MDREEHLMNREFLQLGHLFQSEKHSIVGKYISEKLDGVRCFWDGGISRRLPASTIPYANVLKSDKNAIATGLWSRYGKVIHAPEWFLNQLPPIPLDGELWTTYRDFQNIVSTIQQYEPDERWDDIVYCVFDTMSLYDVLVDGRINNLNWKTEFKDHHLWLQKQGIKFDGMRSFKDRLYELTHLGKTDNFEIVEQIKLSDDVRVAESQITEKLYEVIDNGGEGLMLRSPQAIWVPRRTQDILKIKECDEDEGTIIGVRDGEGRHVGRMGSLEVRWNNQTFNVGTGFTDLEREAEWPINGKIIFRYRGLTTAGIPKEARFLNKVN